MISFYFLYFRFMISGIRWKHKLLFHRVQNLSNWIEIAPVLLPVVFYAKFGHLCYGNSTF